MPQPFGRWTNVGSRGSIMGLLLLSAAVTWLGIVSISSSYGTNAGVAVVQDVPFSHKHHVGVLGIDCRYCHTTVERSSFAGIPSTSICMNCHSQMWVGSEMLEPVRTSYRTNRPLKWQRVYNVPGFVYFDHSVHVQNGVGCSSCHGQIDQMPFTQQVPTLLMRWCLDCHRNPAEQLRPRSEVFNVNYVPPKNQQELGKQLMDEYHILSAERLTSCSVCHR